MKRHRVWLTLPLALLGGLLGALPAEAQDELFVANAGANSVTVYSRTASGNTVPEWQLASDEQPAPAQGPGPISPGIGPQAPPQALPSTGEATEVPIGRPEGYEEEKQKALEVPFGGRPPGTIQEDPAVHRRRPETGSCEGR